MMIDPPIGELLKKVDCRYTLAVEAAKRAREIIGGAAPLIDTKETKPLSIAIILKIIVPVRRGFVNLFPRFFTIFPPDISAAFA